MAYKLLSFEEFQLNINDEYNLYPIVCTVMADMETPLSAYLKLSCGSNKNPSMLLESVEGGENLARYSFIAMDPYRTLTQNGVDPLIEIEKELSCYKVASIPQLQSFTGGALGYISYDCVQYFEPSVNIPEDDQLQIPESWFMFCKKIAIFDHVKHSLTLVINVVVDDHMKQSNKDLKEIYDQAVIKLIEMKTRLESPLPLTAPNAPINVESKTKPGEPNQEMYEKFVNTLKDHIIDGDIIQAVPSQRVSHQLKKATALDIYRQLRVINPSPYMFFVNTGTFNIVGASPEQLIKVENNIVTTHPIAGTRPRGKNKIDDDNYAKELLANEKERAEHIMLVDLGRNDIGRVAKPGTVKVDSLMKIERYSHVMHIVSRVSGELDCNKTAYDAFRSVFPAGTVSGAPKVRAMQLVSGLERTRRGIYAGALGCIGFNGTMDMCIAIRTMLVKDGYAHLQAGGGIVYDSVPYDEYIESINKMKALARAVEAADEEALNPSIRGTSMKNYNGILKNLPSTFGKFGGRYVPETLVGAMEDLEAEYIRCINDPEFHAELKALQRDYVGRPTPLYYADRLTKYCNGARIWLKREDLAHTGAHKINNALGQGLVAKRIGKKRIIAETGAGQHGVATATACALLNLDCTIYMGEEDIKRQALNVFRIKMLGAKVIPVTSGSRTLKDAVNEALRDWVTNVETSHFIIGSAIGPHPFPTIVRDFQCCIGEESRAQMLAQAHKLPDAVICCVGGGSNAIGMFHPLVDDKDVKLYGVEAAGHGVDTDKHAATLVGGRIGVLHGTRTYLLQNDDGQITATHSISAGLDYPGVGPEHSYLKDSGRVKYVPITDKQALEALQTVTRLEGIIPALEPSHALAFGLQLAQEMKPDEDLLINLCGRGDKDMVQVSDALNIQLMDDKKNNINLEQKNIRNDHVRN